MKQYDFSIRQSGTRSGSNMQHSAAPRFSSPSTFIEPKMKVHNQGNFYRKNSGSEIDRNSYQENSTATDTRGSSSSFAQAEGQRTQSDNYWSSIPAQVRVPQFVKPLDPDLTSMSDFRKTPDKSQTSDNNQKEFNSQDEILADVNQDNKPFDDCPKRERHHTDKSQCDKTILKKRGNRAEHFGDEMLLIFLLLMLSGEKSNSCLMLAILYIFM